MHTHSLAEAHLTTPADGRRFLRLLADESRQAIVRLLALSDQRAGEIGALIRLPPNAVSYHLKQLIVDIARISATASIVEHSQVAQLL